MKSEMRRGEILSQKIAIGQMVRDDLHAAFQLGISAREPRLMGGFRASLPSRRYAALVADADPSRTDT